MDHVILRVITSTQYINDGYPVLRQRRPETTPNNYTIHITVYCLYRLYCKNCSVLTVHFFRGTVYSRGGRRGWEEGVGGGV